MGAPLMSDSGYSTKEVNEQLVPFWVAVSLWYHSRGQERVLLMTRKPKTPSRVLG